MSQSQMEVWKLAAENIYHASFTGTDWWWLVLTILLIVVAIWLGYQYNVDQNPDASKSESSTASETVTPSAVSSDSEAADPAEKAKKPAAKSTKAKAAKSASKSKPSSAQSKGPERLKKPNDVADDLKQISGVGPKLEEKLNALGFWHFQQIAAWKKADIAIVDDELSFKGRIERDDWVKQAKALAKKKN